MNKAVMLGLAIIAASGSGQMNNPDRSEDIAPARDGDIAIQQELCAARVAKTIEAYDIFIARHPQHELAEIARRERDQLLADAAKRR